MTRILVLIVIFLGVTLNSYSLDFFDNNKIIKREMSFTVNGKVIEVDVHHII